MSLNNLKIGKRLALGFGSLLALMALLFATAFWQLVLNAQSTSKATEYDRRAGLVTEWSALTESNIIRTVAIAKSAGMPQVEAYFAPQMKETSARISELQKELESVISSEKGKALLAEVGEKRKAYIDQRKEVIALIKNADHMAAEAMLTNKVIPAAQTYLQAMHAIRAYENELAAEHAKAVSDGLAQGKVELTVLLLAGLALGSLMAWSIARSVTVPVREAVQAAEVIAGGDLTHSVSSTRGDELGDLLRAIGGMQESLRSLVGRVRSSTDSIGTASVQIATGNQDLSARTEQTASNLQQAASSMGSVRLMRWSVRRPCGKL